MSSYQTTNTRPIPRPPLPGMVKKLLIQDPRYQDDREQVFLTFIDPIKQLPMSDKSISIERFRYPSLGPPGIADAAETYLKQEAWIILTRLQALQLARSILEEFAPLESVIREGGSDAKLE